jgi:hypothetical protein
MTKIETPPDLSPGYPSQGARLGPAWADIWNALARTPEQAQDIYPIAATVAETHGLAVSTLIGLTKRAATAGLLERSAELVYTGKRGRRMRTHYKIVAEIER